MTSEPEKVQQVAEALREQCKQEFGSTWSYDVAWRLARAAIGAMRHITEEMDDAGFANNYGRYATAAYQAMIDAALSTPPETDNEQQ